MGKHGGEVGGWPGVARNSNYVASVETRNFADVIGLLLLDVFTSLLRGVFLFYLRIDRFFPCFVGFGQPPVVGGTTLIKTTVHDPRKFRGPVRQFTTFSLLEVSEVFHNSIRFTGTRISEIVIDFDCMMIFCWNESFLYQSIRVFHVTYILLLHVCSDTSFDMDRELVLNLSYYGYRTYWMNSFINRELVTCILYYGHRTYRVSLYMDKELATCILYYGQRTHSCKRQIHCGMYSGENINKTLFTKWTCLGGKINNVFYVDIYEMNKSIVYVHVKYNSWFFVLQAKVTYVCRYYIFFCRKVRQEHLVEIFKAATSYLTFAFKEWG